MSENTSGSSKKRKAISATLTVAMATTMLLSGTLAYFYQSRAINTVTGQQLKKLAIAHDDFDPETGNKDVYVENAGESTLYVRIKLTEDYRDSEQAEIDATAEGAKKYDYKNGYGVAANGVDGAMTHQISFTDSTGENLSDVDKPFHENYFKLVWGTEGKTYLRGTATGDQGYSTDLSSASAQKLDEREMIAYDSENSGNLYTQTSTNDDEIGKTSDCDGVIGSRVWINSVSGTNYETKLASAKNMQRYCGWLYAADGWAYWSQPLKPREATGLLLDKIKKLGKVADDQLEYEYNIHVNFEAVDETDVGLWLGEKTEASSGDTWSSTAAEDTGKEVISKLRNYASLNFDYVDSEEVRVRNLCKNITVPLKEGGTSESFDCPEAENKLNDLIVSTYSGNKDIDSFRSGIRGIEDFLENYKAQKKAFLDGVEGAVDPNAPLLVKSDTGDPSQIVMGDDALSNYLINTYGDAESGGLSTAQLSSITSITLDGKHTGKIKNLSYLKQKYFPNLETLSFKAVSMQKEEGSPETYMELSDLPTTLKSIGFLWFYGDEIAVDVSNLSLTSFSTDENTSFTKMTKVKEKGGVFGLYSSGNVNSLKTLDLRSLSAVLDSSGNPSSSFNAGLFPELETFYIGNAVSSLSLADADKMKEFLLQNNKKVSVVDISDCDSLLTFNTFNGNTFEYVKCRDEQTVVNTVQTKAEYQISRKVYVADDPKKAYYYKVDNGSSLRVATTEFTLPS